MEAFRDAVKHRLLPCVGWLFCSFLFMIIGWICGYVIGQICVTMGWIHFSDDMFSGLSILIFPVVGGVIGVLFMHVLRLRNWRKQDTYYRYVYEKWTSRHTLYIVIFDEVIWMISFALIWVLLVKVL